jgi:hypothetical protein
MRLIVHIGNHKTGSTAIQTAFSRNAGILKQKGVLYPKTGMVKNAHHIIPLSLRCESVPGFDVVSDIEALSRELIDEVKLVRPEVVVISSEEFFLCSSDEFDLLKPFFSLFTSVDFVCVLRNQLQHIESGYKFSVLWDVISEVVTFDDYLETNISNEYHNYYERINELCSYSEIDNLIVLDFDLLIKDRQLISNFLKSIDLGTLSLAEIDNNKSLSRMATLGLSLYNNNFVNSMSRKDFVSFLEVAFQKSESLYSNENYDKVIDKFTESNTKLYKISGVDLAKSIPKKSKLALNGGYFRPRDIAILYQLIADKG